MVAEVPGRRCSPQVKNSNPAVNEGPTSDATDRAGAATPSATSRKKGDLGSVRRDNYDVTVKKVAARPPEGGSGPSRHNGDQDVVVQGAKDMTPFRSPIPRFEGGISRNRTS